MAMLSQLCSSEREQALWDRLWALLGRIMWKASSRHGQRPASLAHQHSKHVRRSLVTKGPHCSMRRMARRMQA